MRLSGVLGQCIAQRPPRRKCPGIHSCAMIRRAIASRKLGSIRNVLRGGSMPNSQAFREEACPTVIVVGKEACAAPNTVVYRFVREIPLVEKYAVANDLVASLVEMRHRTQSRAIIWRAMGSVLQPPTFISNFRTQILLSRLTDDLSQI